MVFVGVVMFVWVIFCVAVLFFGDVEFAVWLFTGVVVLVEVLFMTVLFVWMIGKVVFVGAANVLFEAVVFSNLLTF